MENTQVFYKGKQGLTKKDEFTKDELLITVILTDMGYKISRYEPYQDVKSMGEAIRYNENGVLDVKNDKFAKGGGNSLITNFWKIYGEKYVDYKFPNLSKGELNAVTKALYKNYLNTDFFLNVEIYNKNWNESNADEDSNYHIAFNLVDHLWSRVITNIKAMLHSKVYVKDRVSKSTVKTYLVLDKPVHWNYSYDLIKDFYFIITPKDDIWRVHAVPTSKKYANDPKIPVKKEWVKDPLNGIEDVSGNLMWVDCLSREVAVDVAIYLYESEF